MPLWYLPTTTYIKISTKFYARRFHLNDYIFPNINLNQIKERNVFNECLQGFYAKLSSSSLNINGDEEHSKEKFNSKGNRTQNLFPVHSCI